MLSIFQIEKQAVGGAWSRVDMLPEAAAAHIGVKELALPAAVAFTLGRRPEGSFNAEAFSFSGAILLN